MGLASQGVFLDKSKSFSYFCPMKKYSLSILFLIWASITFAQQPNINIQHYAFSIELSDSTDKIQGNAVIDLLITDKNTQTITLDLVGKSGEKGMVVSAVKAGKKTVSFQQKGESLIISLSDFSEIPDRLQLSIAYGGIPADGLIIAKNKFGDRTFFGDNWPNRAHNWIPCVDHPADKASVEWIVTAPEHYAIIANGEQIEETSLAFKPNADRVPNPVSVRLKRTHWKSSVILPTKVMVIGAARFAVELAGTYKDIPVTSWVYPQDRDKGFYDYAVALQVLEFMESHIGPYPYAKLANVQSKTRYGGMENASCIFYSESSVTGDRESEKLIAHEIAHQWFGNSASEKEWFHIWLSEGFATYFTHLYVEYTYGRETMVKDLLQDRARVLTFHKISARPIVDTTVTDLNNLLNPNSYQKGSWVLHMLRYVIGDVAFWQGITEYYGEFQLGNALTGDLQRVMERVSKRELGWFFDQWVYQAGHPVYEGNWKAKKGKVTLSLTQKQELLFEMPLEVGIYYEGIVEPHIEKILMNERKADFEFSVGKNVEKVVLDPNVWVLMERKVEKK